MSKQKCPFDDPKFKIPDKTPCPVCEMLADDKKNICINTPDKYKIIKDGC